MHQILQWHHLLTATGDQPATTIDGLEANTLADGLFYLATWVIVLAATAMTVKAWRDGGWRRRGGSTSGCCTLMHGEFFSRPTSYLDLVAVERRTLRALVLGSVIRALSRIRTRSMGPEDARTRSTGGPACRRPEAGYRAWASEGRPERRDDER
jgi:hypothetical protein